VDSFLREAAAISEVGAVEPPPDGRLVPGEVVGERFRIERLAGTGGMGAVYRAEDLAMGGHVAVKVMGTQHASGGERFQREGAVLAELAHPCIVRYVAHGLPPRGSPFLAMDWLDGEDLYHRLARSTLEAHDSFAIARCVCEGLTVAHARARSFIETSSRAICFSSGARPPRRRSSTSASRASSPGRRR
jgi:hypothetical protein